jgi:hypothetical protein
MILIQFLIKNLKERYHLENLAQFDEIVILTYELEECVDFVSLSQDKEQRRILVGTVMKRVPWNTGTILTR